MDKDNVFRSCTFHMNAGDVLHVLIKDLVGTAPDIGLNDEDGNEEDSYTELAQSEYGFMYNAFVALEGDPTIEYGALYNWYAATDVREICSAGWHIPTLAEFNILSTYLGGDTVSGGKLKETGTTYWTTPNTGATNEVGFNAKGSSNRNGGSGQFQPAGFGIYFSMIFSDALVGGMTSVLGLVYNSGAIAYKSPVGYFYPFYGASLRPIKDSTTLTHGQTGTYTGNDGKVYRTICIGTQEWVADNLAETKYRNGDDIPVVTVNAAWAALATGAMCYYNNNIDNAYVTDSTIANTGWRVPTITDFTTLQTYLGGEALAGGKLKEEGLTYWNDPNLGATNEVGFNGRGAGARNMVGTFIDIKQICHMWSSTIYDANFTYYAALWWAFADMLVNGATGNAAGHVFRLVKETTTLTHGQVGTYTGNDGKIYNTICIGTQEWLSENLKETKFRDGTVIPEVQDTATWAALTTPALCVYENDWENA